MYRRIDSNFPLDELAAEKSGKPGLMEEQRERSYKRKSQPAFLMTVVLTMVAIMTVAGCNALTTTTQNKALWIANDEDVLEYIPLQLQPQTAELPPHLILKTSVFGAPQGLVFDAAGDLWVIDGGTEVVGGLIPPSLYQFTPSQLSSLSKTETLPNITVNSKALKFPQQAIFDANGNLWVSDSGNNQVVQFTASQLSTSATAVVPNLTITSNPAFTGPIGIALDSSGDLWVANNLTTTIFEFKAANLPTAAGTVATLTPDVILSDNGGITIQNPWALAFDKAGNLWSSNQHGPSTVVQFSAASLKATGNPMPAVTLSPTKVQGQVTLSSPLGITFDVVGDLIAISGQVPFGISLYSKGQLTAGGAVDPNVFIVGSAKTTLNNPTGCTFGPIH